MTKERIYFTIIEEAPGLMLSSDGKVYKKSWKELKTIQRGKYSFIRYSTLGKTHLLSLPKLMKKYFLEQ